MTASAPTGTTGSAKDLSGLARGGSIATLGAITAAGGGFLLTLVVGRGLGADGAGLFFSAVAVFTIASSVAALGADTALLRALSRAVALGRRSEIRRILLVALAPVVVATIVVTTVLLLWVPALTDLVVHGPSGADADRSFYLLLPFLVFGTLTTVLLQATRAFGGVVPFVAVQNVLLPLGRPLAVLLLVVAGWSALAVPLSWALFFVPGLAIAAWTLTRQVRRAQLRDDPDPEPPRSIRSIAADFWSFSAVRGLASAIDLSLVWFDVILVSALRSTGEAGVYATASRFITSGTLVLQAMRLAVAPRISALMSTGQRERTSDLYRVATLWVVVSSWPLYLGLALFGSLVLRFFGDDFADGSTALSILAVCMLLNLGTGNVGTVLLMAGRSSWVLIDKLAALAVNVALNLLLVPAHGITGAALAWGAAVAVDNLLAVAQVHRGLGVHGYGRSTFLLGGAALVAFGGGGLLAQALWGHGYPALAGYLLCAGTAYAAALWWWRDDLHIDELRAAFGSRRRQVPSTVAGPRKGG